MLIHNGLRFIKDIDIIAQGTKDCNNFGEKVTP